MKNLLFFIYKEKIKIFTSLDNILFENQKKELIKIDNFMDKFDMIENIIMCISNNNPSRYIVEKWTTSYINEKLIKMLKYHYRNMLLPTYFYDFLYNLTCHK